jgi:hypothetical protein
MITYDHAKKIAQQKIQEIQQKSRYKLVLLEDKTITVEYGWVFFYYPEEGLKDPTIRFGGGGPFIVNKFDGWVIRTNSRKDIQYYIDLYIKFMQDWRE